MKKLIRYVVSPIIFLLVYSLVEYLVRGEIDLRMIIFSTVLYTILNAVFHILFDKKLD